MELNVNDGSDNHFTLRNDMELDARDMGAVSLIIKAIEFSL